MDLAIGDRFVLGINDLKDMFFLPTYTRPDMKPPKIIDSNQKSTGTVCNAMAWYVRV